MSSIDVTNFIRKDYDSACDQLEHGLQFGFPEEMKNVIPIFKRLLTLIPECHGKLIRCYTGLCVVDPLNALGYLESACKFDPRNPDVLNNLGYIYYKQRGDYVKGIRFYQTCLEVCPNHVVAYLGIIDIYRIQKLHYLEKMYVKKGLESCPSSSELWNCQGLMHLSQGENLVKILDCFERAILLHPPAETLTKIHINIGHVYGVTGDYNRAVEEYILAIQASTDNNLAYENILLNINYFYRFTPTFRALLNFLDIDEGMSLKKAVCEIHKAISKRLYTHDKIALPEKRDSSTKMRIGYIGSDFDNHAVTNFLRTCIQYYTKVGFEVYIYSNTVYPTAVVQSMDVTGYRCIFSVSTEDACKAIVDDKIDVLVDTSGYTSGNRLDVVARLPAKTVLTYIGYPNDLAIPGVRRVSDRYSEAFSLGRNETIDLQRFFLCYTPNHLDEPKENKDPTIITFGCFAKLPKINDHVISVWCKVLELVPDSRLVLKSKFFSEKAFSQLWKNKFGVYADRVMPLRASKDHSSHLRIFTVIDLHLDTFPYSGTTISSESLYMNVPVVTLAPQLPETGHVERVTGSLLNSIGLPELIARDEEEYINKAVYFSTRTRELDVRTKLLASPEIGRAHV